SREALSTSPGINLTAQTQHIVADAEEISEFDIAAKTPEPLIPPLAGVPATPQPSTSGAVISQPSAQAPLS
ncbi:hypothetical protein AAVH_31494, partial [Aphelenchoides avenae]